jgi:hypothetical protein
MDERKVREVIARWRKQVANGIKLFIEGVIPNAIAIHVFESCADELEAALASEPDGPEHDGYYLNDAWVRCRESCPACKLRAAASKFGARVFERFPSWKEEQGTDLAESRNELTAAILGQPTAALASEPPAPSAAPAGVREGIIREVCAAFDDEYCKHNDPLIGVLRARIAMAALAAAQGQPAERSKP